MAEQTIDKLQIELEARAGRSVSNIEKLAQSLDRLKSVTSGGVSGLSKTAAALDRLQSAAAGLKGRSSALTSIAKSLNALSAVRLPATERLSEFANAFSGFGGAVESMREFRSGVGSLKTAFNNLDKIKFEGMAARIRQLVDAIKPLTDEMIRGGKYAGDYGTQLKALVSAAKQTNAIRALQTENKTSYASHRANAQSWSFEKIGIAFDVLRGIGSTIGGFVTEINDYIEDLNLFTVAMGDFAEQGLAFAEKMQTALGINAGEAMRYMGVFQQMATSMGFTQERAYTLSTTLTQLGYDWSSFYNLDTEESFTKLQAAISGEIEPVRRLGIDISSARLQQELYNLGIQESVENLNQADKATLRYIALLKQSENAMGDLSRSIESPSNALRLLNAQWEVAKREIGSVFIPMLLKILPPAIAVVRILGEMARSLANLLGFELPTIDYSSVGNLSVGLTDAADSADDLTDSVKETKKEISGLLGFDEINALSETETGSSGTSASANTDMSSVLGDVELPTYDMFTEIENSVDQWVEKLEDPVKWLLAAAGLIGTTILGWKISSPFLKGLDGTSSLAGTILKTLSGVTGLGLGGTLGIMAAIVAAVIALAGGFTDVYKRSEDFQTGLTAIWDGLKWIARTLFYDIPQGIGPIGEALDKANDKFEEMTGGLMSFGDLVINAVSPPFEAFVLFAKAIGISINDSLEGSVHDVEIFSDQISETTRTKLEPFLEQIDTLDQTMKTLKWSGQIIDQSVVDDVKQKVSEISDAIISELDADQNEALQNLSPLSGMLSPDKYNEVIAASTQHYDTLKQQVTDGQAEINAIIQRASDEKRALTQEEYDEISAIQMQMRDTGIQYMSESETEMNLIQQRLTDNTVQLSAVQAAEIVKNAKTARDETITQAQEQYDAIALEAQRMFDIGAINKDTYDEIIAAAENAKTETTTKANEQYDEILAAAQEQSGDLVNQVDWETGEIKSKYAIWWDDLKAQWKQGWEDCKTEFSDGMNQIKTAFTDWWNGVKTWWNDNVAPIFTKKYWTDKFDNLVQGAREKLDELKKTFANWTASIKTPHFSWDMDGLKTSGTLKEILELLNLPTSLPKLSVSWYAQGGIFNSPQIIGVGERGPEAVVPLSDNAAWIEALSENIARREAQITNYTIPERYDNQGGDWTFIIQREDGAVESEYTLTAAERSNSRHGRTIIPVGV